MGAGKNLTRGKAGKEMSITHMLQLCEDRCYWGTIRDHYKRGLNTRKVCQEKAARIKRILNRDPELTEDMIKQGDEES